MPWQNTIQQQKCWGVIMAVRNCTHNAACPLAARPAAPSYWGLFLCSFLQHEVLPSIRTFFHGKNHDVFETSCNQAGLKSLEILVETWVGRSNINTGHQLIPNFNLRNLRLQIHPADANLDEKQGMVRAPYFGRTEFITFQNRTFGFSAVQHMGFDPTLI